MLVFIFYPKQPILCRCDVKSKQTKHFSLSFTGKSPLYIVNRLNYITNST
jgi:hypothetical protein